MSHSTPEPEGRDPLGGFAPDAGTTPADGGSTGYEPAGTTGVPGSTYAAPGPTGPGYTEPYGETYADPAPPVVVEEDLVPAAPEGPYGQDQPSGSALGDTAAEQGREVAGTAKEQAGQVKDTAVEQGREVAGTAKEQAGQVKDTVVEQGRQVADVAKDEAGQVTQEASARLRDLVGQSRSELVTQAGTQQQRLADYVHALADELGTMASGSKASGPLTDLAHRGSRTGGEVAHWLSEHEPADVLDQVSRFARRRPFAFLGASLLAGVVVGRVTRSLAAEAKDEQDAQQADGPVEVGGSAGPDVETVTAPSGYVVPDRLAPGSDGVPPTTSVDPLATGYPTPASEPYPPSGPQGGPTGQAWLGEGR